MSLWTKLLHNTKDVLLEIVFAFGAHVKSMVDDRNEVSVVNRGDKFQRFSRNCWDIIAKFWRRGRLQAEKSWVQSSFYFQVGVGQVYYVDDFLNALQSKFDCGHSVFSTIVLLLANPLIFCWFLFWCLITGLYQRPQPQFCQLPMTGLWLWKRKLYQRAILRGVVNKRFSWSRDFLNQVYARVILVWLLTESKFLVPIFLDTCGRQRSFPVFHYPIDTWVYQSYLGWWW